MFKEFISFLHNRKHTSEPRLLLGRLTAGELHALGATDPKKVGAVLEATNQRLASEGQPVLRYGEKEDALQRNALCNANRQTRLVAVK
ncbi:MAG: hypothetical protein Q7S79_00225 [bacterium]|nr:hypothetical protein [bacterium]